jgi:ubiquinone/menaquinone biosynthesis C-methylase UbiE
VSFKDHFSGHAAAYSAHRPHYPQALFDWLAEQAPARKLALDCATGSGQAAIALAAHFERVLATDASAAQIDNAEAHPQVEYRVALAEDSGLPDASVDLITVAQAYHWFDHAAFGAEAERVLAPSGLLAVWGYAFLSAGDDIEPIVHRYYSETVGPYWPPERAHVEAGYRDLPFAFADETPPEFAMTAQWTRQQLVNYLGTWSSSQRYIAAGHPDPLPALDAELSPHWPDEQTREIRWPLFIRIGRKA